MNLGRRMKVCYPGRDGGAEMLRRWLRVGPDCVLTIIWAHSHTQRGVDKVSRLVWDRLGLKGLWLINLETTSQ